MNRPSNRLRAFTLIELMISLAAGLLVVFIATAGFRAASASLTAAHRLVTENMLVATGISSLYHEIDHWDHYDDRYSASRAANPLRQLHPTGVKMLIPAPYQVLGETSCLQLGLPFTPFARSGWGVGSDANPFPTSTTAPTGQDYGGGWFENEQYWSICATNRKTWWNADAMEGWTYGDWAHGICAPDCKFGRPAIFGISLLPSQTTVRIDGGGLETSPYKSPTTLVDANSQTRSNGGPIYAQSLPVQTGDRVNGWIYNQIRGCANALGWYGMMDYLPASTFFGYIRPYNPPLLANAYVQANASINNPDPTDARPQEMTSATGCPIYFTNGIYPIDDTNQPGHQSAKDLGPQRAGLAYATPYFVLRSWDSSHSFCAGREGLTANAAYAIIPPDAFAGTANPIQQLVFYHRNAMTIAISDHGNSTAYESYNNSNIVQLGGSSEFRFDRTFATSQGSTDLHFRYDGRVLETYIGRTSNVRRLMAMAPLEWPRITTSVNHLLRQSRFSNQAKVSWFDAVSGRLAELRFSLIGTTLRGARRQRDLDRPNP